MFSSKMDAQPSAHRLPIVPVGTSIPRIIHQTHHTAELPQELAESIAALRGANPRWDYRFYDDAGIEAFILSAYGDDIYGKYRRIDPSYGAARADLFRYLLIYRVGGIYLDIKSTFTRPIDEVLRPDDLYLLAGWRNATGEEFAGWGTSPRVREILPSEYQQWHIVAAAGHPFLRAVIERVLTNIDLYRPWRHGVGHRGVYAVTGPEAYTLAIHPIAGRHAHRCRRYNEDLGLRYSIYGFYGHHKLFKSHYVKQARPVVVMTGALRCPSILFCTLVGAASRVRSFGRKLVAPLIRLKRRGDAARSEQPPPARKSA